MSQTVFGEGTTAERVSEIWKNGVLFWDLDLFAMYRGDGTTPGGIPAEGGNSPTSEQRNALAGTSGAPGDGNRYVTNEDPRNTNARSPVTQAAVADVNQSSLPEASDISSLPIGEDYNQTEVQALRTECQNLRDALAASSQTVNELLSRVRAFGGIANE